MNKDHLAWLLKIRRNKISDDEYDILLLVLGDVPIKRISRRFNEQPMKMNRIIEKAIAKLRQ